MLIESLEGASPLAPRIAIYTLLADNFQGLRRGIAFGDSYDGCEGPQPSKPLWTNVDPKAESGCSSPLIKHERAGEDHKGERPPRLTIESQPLVLYQLVNKHA
jgi:hypothetical protein